MTSANVGNGFCPQQVTVDDYLWQHMRTACFPAALNTSVQLEEKKPLLLSIHTRGMHTTLALYSG